MIFVFPLRTGSNGSHALLCPRVAPSVPGRVTRGEAGVSLAQVAQGAEVLVIKREGTVGDVAVRRPRVTLAGQAGKGKGWALGSKVTCRSAELHGVGGQPSLRTCETVTRLSGSQHDAPWRVFGATKVEMCHKRLI